MTLHALFEALRWVFFFVGVATVAWIIRQHIRARREDRRMAEREWKS